MSDTVTFRQAVREDLPQMLEVLKVALGQPPLLKRTPELFTWKHYDNPFGESTILVAETDGRIVGVRAFMRWDLTDVGGDVVRCVRAVDTATHPDYARRGIFRALTQQAIEVVMQRGIDLVFNTPNPKSAAGYLKMGWQEVGWIGAMVRPRLLGVEPIEPAVLPTADQVLPHAAVFDHFDIDDRPALGLRTPRTSEYLRWRFSGHPTARYAWIEGSAGGGAVVRPSLRRARSETMVSDVLGDGTSSAMRRTASLSRSRYVATWFSKHSPERRAAILAGLLPLPGIKTLRLVARPLTDIDVDVFDIGCWDLAISDLELL